MTKREASKKSVINPGDRFEFPYPFLRGKKTLLLDEDGPYQAMHWIPGVRSEEGEPDPYYDRDGTILTADGVGKQVVTVVDVFRPGSFQTRVFYTRQWKAPTGYLFGKKNTLRIATLGNFRRLIAGYPWCFTVVGKGSS